MNLSRDELTARLRRCDDPIAKRLILLVMDASTTIKQGPKPVPAKALLYVYRARLERYDNTRGPIINGMRELVSLLEHTPIVAWSVIAISKNDDMRGAIFAADGDDTVSCIEFVND